MFFHDTIILSIRIQLVDVYLLNFGLMDLIEEATLDAILSFSLYNI